LDSLFFPFPPPGWRAHAKGCGSPPPPFFLPALHGRGRKGIFASVMTISAPFFFFFFPLPFVLHLCTAQEFREDESLTLFLLPCWRAGRFTYPFFLFFLYQFSLYLLLGRRRDYRLERASPSLPLSRTGSYRKAFPPYPSLFFFSFPLPFRSPISSAPCATSKWREAGSPPPSRCSRSCKKNPLSFLPPPLVILPLELEEKEVFFPPELIERGGFCFFFSVQDCLP